jgi:hypothetical protein
MGTSTMYDFGNGTAFDGQCIKSDVPSWIKSDVPLGNLSLPSQTSQHYPVWKKVITRFNDSSDCFPAQEKSMD